MDNLKNVRISMFDRTNNSSQPVNVVTSANAVIVDGEEKNIKEYVDSNNLINTHISPKVDFGKYTTQSDLFGENINDVVSEFIQHYTGGGSNEPPVSPVPTLPTHGSTPAASTTVPVEFTKRVEALETKLAAIESSGNSTSSTTPVSELMFDCIEDIFPVQLDQILYDSTDDHTKRYEKSTILPISEQYYFGTDSEFSVDTYMQPILCIKFKKDTSAETKNSILNNLKIEVHALLMASSHYLTGKKSYKYQKYTYDKVNNIGSIEDNTYYGSNKYYVNNCDYGTYSFIRLTNQSINESQSEFKYNYSFVYTSSLTYEEEKIENLIIQMNGRSEIYKKRIDTCMVPLMYIEFVDNDEDSSILKYEKETEKRNGEFLNLFRVNQIDANLRDLKFDCIGLSLPSPINVMENVYVEKSSNNGDYSVKYNIRIPYSKKTDTCRIVMVASGTLKSYQRENYWEIPTTTLINGENHKIFEEKIADKYKDLFLQRTILTYGGALFIYGPSYHINGKCLEKIEMITKVQYNSGGQYSYGILRKLSNTRFKEKPPVTESTSGSTSNGRGEPIAVNEFDHL